MGKALSDMSLAELWELFPIVLTPHQDCWALWYAEERDALLRLAAGSFPLRVHHIGSTAVRGIWAKPIVDILVELPNEAAIRLMAGRMTEQGYLVMSQQAGRLSLNKGYTEHGFAEKVFHIHLRLDGDNEELAFRNCLNSRPDVARAYEKLKLSLWKTYEHDRAGYTRAKTDFIRAWTPPAPKA